MKKVFIIFSIVLILFSFTVPCFATDYQAYISNSVSYQSVSLVGDIDGMTVGFDSSDYTFYFDGTSTFQGGLSHYTYLFDNNNRILLNSDHTYFCYFGSDSNPHPALYNRTGYINLVNDFITVPTSDYFTYGFYVNRGSSYSGKFYFVLIDMDLMYPEGHPSYDQVLSDLQSYDYFSKLPEIRSGYFQVTNFFDPYLNFHRDTLSHMFDFVPQLTSTYSGLFVFVTIILSLCIVIFLIVFMFKKFAR